MGDDKKVKDQEGTKDPNVDPVVDPKDKSAENKKTYTAEELKTILDSKDQEVQEKIAAAVKDAASKEKEKLYDTVEKYKKDLEVLAKKAEAEEAEKQKLLQMEEEKKKAELSAKERVAELEKDLEKTSKRFEEVIGIKDLEFKEALRKRDLAILRERLVADAKGEIIPELVQGDSEEQINKAAELARLRYKEIVENQKKQLTDELIRTGKIPGPDGKDKKDNPTDLSGGKSIKEVFELPDEDFLKYKDEVLKKFSG